MNERSKQKRKKKSHGNLNNLQRSRSEMKKNVNLASEQTHAFKNGSKCDNALITCNLAMFKKSIKSKTVTRVPLKKVDNSENVIKTQNSAAMTNTLNSFLHSQNESNNKSESSLLFANTTFPLKSKIISNTFEKNPCEIIVDESKILDSVSPCQPSGNYHKDLEDSTSEEPEYRCEYFCNSSCSNSETESAHCSYEKFMKSLPAYLKEHFPAFTSNFLNKNIAYLTQSSGQKKENNTLCCINTTINIPENHRHSIIQNPLDYIKTGLVWEQSVKKKQDILFSNTSSSSVLKFGSETAHVFLDSPEYQYFPHKLNQ